MSRPTSLLKLTLLTLAAWALTVVVFFISLGVTAGMFPRPFMPGVGTAIRILMIGQFVWACVSIAYVFYLSGGYFRGAMRLVWVVPFAIVQFALWALALLATLLAFNR
jgi:hypothetical protein